MKRNLTRDDDYEMAIIIWELISSISIPGFGGHERYTTTFRVKCLVGCQLAMPNCSGPNHARSQRCLRRGVKKIDADAVA